MATSGLFFLVGLLTGFFLHSQLSHRESQLPRHRRATTLCKHCLMERGDHHGPAGALLPTRKPYYCKSYYGQSQTFDPMSLEKQMAIESGEDNQ